MTQFYRMLCVVNYYSTGIIVWVKRRGGDGNYVYAVSAKETR